MFLRIFRYRVKPQMRDRHLALQARSAQLYGKYVSRAPSYFRRSGDANSWVELHWYADKGECQQVAQAVADDLELSRLWREFQDTLDPDHPPTLEEFSDYELPRPVNASPFSQPPIDDQTIQPVRPEVVKPVVAAIVEEPPVMPTAVHLPADSAHDVEPAAKHSSDNGDGRGHDDEQNANAADAPASKRAENGKGDAEPAQRPFWPSPPLPADKQSEEIVIEDEPPAEPPSTALSFNDGVWIVEPEQRPRRDNN